MKISEISLNQIWRICDNVFNVYIVTYSTKNFFFALKNLSVKKRNASILLGVEPKIFRLPDCIRPAIERSWARYSAEWKRSFFHRKFFQNILKISSSLKWHIVNSKSQVDKVDIVYRGWYSRVPLSRRVIHSSNDRHNRLKWLIKIEWARKCCMSIIWILSWYKNSKSDRTIFLRLGDDIYSIDVVI